MKSLYRELPGHTIKIFEPRQTYKVKDICEVPIDAWINDIYINTPIITEKRTDNQPVTVRMCDVRTFLSKYVRFYSFVPVI